MLAYRRRGEAGPAGWELGPWGSAGEVMPFTLWEAACRACALGPGLKSWLEECGCVWWGITKTDRALGGAQWAH